ncbi:MAG: hypothetical protein O2968_16085 [Acidobacteria bacterium]|nr:hypothetical protein [Acidobacteriota bacterium]
MTDFLQVLEQHWRGVFILVFLITVLALIVRWLFWLLGWGRFAARPDGKSIPGRTGSFFWNQFIAKTVDQFRHLLALLIFLLFSVAVILSILPGLAERNVEQMTDGLQGVAASLGGLIGSIIGYYFGEQVGAASSQSTGETESPGETTLDSAPTDGGIRPPRFDDTQSSQEVSGPRDESPPAAS